jgi:hypothetical protein
VAGTYLPIWRLLSANAGDLSVQEERLSAKLRLLIANVWNLGGEAGGLGSKERKVAHRLADHRRSTWRAHTFFEDKQDHFLAGNVPEMSIFIKLSELLFMQVRAGPAGERRRRRRGAEFQKLLDGA